ncbi:MAG: hypothetical protein AAFU79_14830 [Myxococcota bacterium]
MVNTRSFPLLLLPILIYNVLVFVSPIPSMDSDECSNFLQHNVHEMTCRLEYTVLHIPMRSTSLANPDGDTEPVHWLISIGDILMVMSLMLLFVELLKSTDSEVSSLFNHGFSFMVFLLGLVQFLLYPPYATTVFFMLTLMAMLDVLAGFMVTLSAARREVNLVGGR